MALIIPFGILVFCCFPNNYIHGFTLSNDSANPNTTVDIASGTCTDKYNQAAIQNTSTLTVNLTTNGANGLDTGSKAANSWYHIHAVWALQGLPA